MPVSTLHDAAAPAARRAGLLTIEEAAAYLQIAPGTLKHWALDKKIRYARIGKFMRFRQTELDRFIASRTVAPAEEP